MPFFGNTKIDRGDVLQVSGPSTEVKRVAKVLGYADRATEKTDMVFMGIGIVVGGLLGTLTLTIAGVPVSLSASGGALVGGLVCGWLRSVNRLFGRIPEPALWVFNNVGLNVFVAIVGINAGPSFIAGVMNSGVKLVVCGIVATTLPLLITVFIGRFLKIHAGVFLGACAGGRSATAALGSLEQEANSGVPRLGYSVPYAVSNVLLTTWGSVIVYMMT
jgi:putative transport protein